ncbi:MAG: class I SAM-dependent methyltransferase [Planctomycetota bacterium]|nr:class I SAM-dependent methyltransferase [Planctomycetota bacterium]
MISCPSVTQREIRGHYELSTLFYWLLWGRHIHHGLWEGDESPAQAQQQLTETLCQLGRIQPGNRVLDVGCGMGGSSIHLAKQVGCEVTGVTLSRVQQTWASTSALFHGVSRLTRFLRGDAERVEFPPGSFDVVWSIECTEHLFDKPAFFRRAADWLVPGGRMAICAWLAGDGLDDPARARQVYDVCEGFLCPSLGSFDDYRGWMTEAGLIVEETCDWTDRVWRTWEICRDRVAKSRVRWLAKCLDKNSVLFLDRFDTILNAYKTKAMRYGCLIATKPAERMSR